MCRGSLALFCLLLVQISLKIDFAFVHVCGRLRCSAPTKALNNVGAIYITTAFRTREIRISHKRRDNPSGPIEVPCRQLIGHEAVSTEVDFEGCEHR